MPRVNLKVAQWAPPSQHRINARLQKANSSAPVQNASREEEEIPENDDLPFKYPYSPLNLFQGIFFNFCIQPLRLFMDRIPYPSLYFLAQITTSILKLI